MDSLREPNVITRVIQRRQGDQVSSRSRDDGARDGGDVKTGSRATECKGPLAAEKVGKCLLP